MRTLVVCLVVALGGLAGCSSSDGADEAITEATEFETGEPAADDGTTGSDATDTAAPRAAGDCGDLTSSGVAQYAFTVQILAGVNDAGSLDALDALGYDRAAFAEVLDQLRTVTSGDDDAAAAIHRYAEANERVAALIDAADTATAEDFAAYADLTGGIQEFLVGQLPINQAIDERRPDLPDR